MRSKLNQASRHVLIAMLVLSVLFITTPVHAPPATTLEIINPLNGTHEFNFTTAEKSVGDTFVVNITVVNVTDLFSWQIKAAWNASLLNYSSITLPPDHVFAGKFYLPAGPYIEPGAVTYGVSLAPGQTSFNGGGRLAQLTLKIIQGVSPGRKVECNITFAGLRTDTFLLNSLGTDISFTPVNGHYIYSAPGVPVPQATLYISPPRVVDPTLTVGSKFNVSLSIINATDLHSWKAKILYDKAILNATEVFEGAFLKSAGSTTFSFEIRDYNTTHGFVSMNCTLIALVGASGNGELAIITFEVVGLGSSDIIIFQPDLRDPSNIALPFIWSNGYFNNMLIAKLSIEPSEVKGPEYVPGITFTINVTLDDVENLKTCAFNLTYVPSVIQEISIGFPPVLNQTPVKKLQVDDEAGYIWTNITYRNGITTYEPVTIMTVEFLIVAMGVSPINLTDTQLYDLSNQPITHEVHHGIFMGLIRDVAVINVEPESNMAYQGWIVNITVTVKNKGNLTETFEVKFYFNTTLGNTTTVENLAPNGETNVTLTWNTATVEPCYNYTISAKAGPVPYEMNLGDNELTDGKVKIRWMGDVDGSGKVDMIDVTAAILAFRTYPGHPRWNPEIDLDRNGIIDMRDIVTTILNFNKGCV